VIISPSFSLLLSLPLGTAVVGAQNQRGSIYLSIFVEVGVFVNIHSFAETNGAGAVDCGFAGIASASSFLFSQHCRQYSEPSSSFSGRLSVEYALHPSQ
jgi:hypothetical protein